MTVDPFLAHRGLLFTVAYEMLGAASDARRATVRICRGKVASNA